MIEGVRQSLPRRVKIGYGAPQFAEFVGYSLFASWSMYFFTDVVFLTAAFAGIVTALSTFWDAVTDPIVGMYSDNRDPQKGRRRPILLFNAFFFGIVLWLLYTDFGFGPTAKMIYFTVMILAYKTAHTLLDIPYTALGAEMTKCYDERSSLNSYRNFFGNVAGLVVGSGMLLFAGFFGELFGNIKVGWSVSVGILAILSTVFILIGWRATRGYELKEIENVQRTRYKDYLDVFKNKPFVFIAAMFAMSTVAQAFSNVVTIYWLMQNMQMSDAQLTSILAFFWIFSIAFVPILDFMAHRTSKKKTWNVSMLAWALSAFIFPLYILDSPDMYWGVVAFTIFLAMGITAQYQLSWAMIPDCIELDEFRTGHRREGLYYSCVTFVQKFAMAIGYFVCGWLLTRVGYVGDTELSQPTLQGINNLWVYGQVVPLAITLGIGYFYPLTRNNHAALCEAIQLKNAQKPYAIDGFRSLLNHSDLVVAEVYSDETKQVSDRSEMGDD